MISNTFVKKMQANGGVVNDHHGVGVKLGKLMKEWGVVERIWKTAQNGLMNIVTIFLGVSVGATATGTTFLSPKALAIMGMGVVAFGFGTAGGVLLAKFMNLFLKEKINPLIGSAGVSEN